ncbi:UNVERIFIED_CONTAM: Williams Beuren syndrome chromosome region 22 protein [Siphonaria sp. JEL0065]|nr:Williams Beuren syndrome chromosome region 22 protein [Siphonaria sp. JEL0065]
MFSAGRRFPTLAADGIGQFYPEGPEMRAGFTGGLVVDYPNPTKAKKYFLCLFAGYAGDQKSSPAVPKGLDSEDNLQSVEYAGEVQ